MKFLPRECLLFAYAIVVLFGMLMPANSTVAQEAEKPTTFFVVRHADRDGEHDALTDKGKQRAEELAVIMKNFRLSAVYSTNTIRTKDTARPTAEALELDITTYGDLTAEWFDEINTKHSGQSVLIVAHSNTSGEVARKLGGIGLFEMDEDEFDRLIVVTVRKEGINSVAIQFGQPTGPDR